jgi:hypothetical protein
MRRGEWGVQRSAFIPFRQAAQPLCARPALRYLLNESKDPCASETSQPFREQTRASPPSFEPSLENSSLVFCPINSLSARRSPRRRAVSLVGTLRPGRPIGEPGRRWSLSRSKSEAIGSAIRAPSLIAASVRRTRRQGFQCRKSHSGKPGGAGVARRRPSPRAPTTIRVKPILILCLSDRSGSLVLSFEAGPPRAAKGMTAPPGAACADRLSSLRRLRPLTRLKHLSVQHISAPVGTSGPTGSA